MTTSKKIYMVFAVLSIIISIIAPKPQSFTYRNDESRIVDVGNGQVIEVGPDEVLHTYELSSIPSTYEGVGSPQNVSEYGIRMDQFSGLQMEYNSTNGLTTNDSVSVPMGPLWEGTSMFANISNLEEQRTWVENPGFDSQNNWTLGTYDGGSYSNSITSTIQSGYVRFTMLGEWDGSYYRFDEGDRAYANQSLSIDRGKVTWVGVSTDYWVTQNSGSWGSVPVGFWEFYIQVGHNDVISNHLWDMQFSDVPTVDTWYSSGLQTANKSLFSLPNETIQVGMRTTRSFGCNPRLTPEVRLDNIRVFVKTTVKPSQINLKMNGENVSDYSNGTHTLWSLGSISYTPGETWTGGTAEAVFTWEPIGNPPSPNLPIDVYLSAEITLNARKLNASTLYRADVQSIGDHFSVSNNTLVDWYSFYYVAVPNGYSEYYFFNQTKPVNRVIDFVAEQRHPEDNFTGYWSTGSDYINISVYEGWPDLYQNGFWKVDGHSSNMINNLLMWDGAAWTSTHTYRANDDIRLSALLDTNYQGAVVSFYVYNTSGDLWATVDASVNGSGIAESTPLNLDAYTAETGSWTVHAFVNDSAITGKLMNIGFYSRKFTIQHATSMNVVYPESAVQSWEKNVTFGDTLKIQVKINDSTNGDRLPGGIATYNWSTGPGQMNDNGTGDYVVFLDTSELPSNGRYVVVITWSMQYYDTQIQNFILNVIEETTIQPIPDVNIPRGWNVSLDVFYSDSSQNGIDDAKVVCNWTDSPYQVTPMLGQPGHYSIEITTNESLMDTYLLEVTASKDYYETTQTTLYIEVRQLFSSVGVNTSYLELPIGYHTALTLTYTDTDHNLPINDSVNAISCNWSEFHSQGDLNYTVTEVTSGQYEIIFYSINDDSAGSYNVIFEVKKYAVQNHTFTINIEVVPHLTSFSILNSVVPTAFTGTIEIYVSYYSVTIDAGIGNGSANDYNVLMYVTSPEVSSLAFDVANWTLAGQYLITIQASQWDSIGLKDLTIYANWTGNVAKYENKTLELTIRLSETPTDLYIGESPISTPYLENITFTIFYWDTANNSGIVNSTGPYAYNVSIHVQVLSLEPNLNQSVMMITEVGGGEYRIEFNTSFLSGLIECELRLFTNWTKGKLPLYENRTLLVSIPTTSRQTEIDWALPTLIAYDEPVNLTVRYIDSLRSSSILNASNLYIDIHEDDVLLGIIYSGDATGIFSIAINTTKWGGVGTFSFHLNITWVGKPFYQNRTSIEITITIRKRLTQLSHGSYSDVQYGNNITILLTYTDLDDQSSVGMNGSILTINSTLIGYYDAFDNKDGTYNITIDTNAFSSLDTYAINASISYGGIRFCEDAFDIFYITIVRRHAQLTSEPPDLAPFLSLANITISYFDDNNNSGIENAMIHANCSSSLQILEKNVNYWVEGLTDGVYAVRINTTALGTFKSYTITITANWSGKPFYIERVLDVVIQVSRRPTSLTVSKSPLTTAFLEIVSFEITITDTLSDTGISLTKSELLLSHGLGIEIDSSDYSFIGANGVYTISLLSTLLTSSLVEGHPIQVEFSWGEIEPYYNNASTSTQVTISPRLTQSSVLSTPPAFYYFNATAVIDYSDYLSNGPIVNASIVFECFNDSSIIGGYFDKFDGTYEIWVDTSSLPVIGNYLFIVNITYFGSPFYQNITNVEFTITVNAVATTLNFGITEGVTFYLGDIVTATLSFKALVSGTGIDSAIIENDWEELYGTQITITSIPDVVGSYSIEIETSGLDAQLYSFDINASKYLHQNRTITADILLSPIPVTIALDVTPTGPVWGDILNLTANVTDFRNGAPIEYGNVNLTIASTIFQMTYIDNGLYNVKVPTKQFQAGEYKTTITFSLKNHEKPNPDFQLRISKVTSKLSGSLDPQTSVYGQTVTLSVDYSIEENGTAITDANLTYSWIGGSGVLTFNETLSKWISHFVIEEILDGSFQILVQASSKNYKSLYTEVTIDIREVSTSLHSQISQFIEAKHGDFIDIIVYLNNTVINASITGANLTYGIGSLFGNLTEIGNGYYSSSIPTATLDIDTYILTVTSEKEGYSQASLQYTLAIERIPTVVEAIGNATKTVTYGNNVSFAVQYLDDHNNLGIENATTSYRIGGVGYELIELGGGNYSLTFNSSVFRASRVNRPQTITISFQKARYEYAFFTINLRVQPIDTVIKGSRTLESIPVYWEYVQNFEYIDERNNQSIDGATAYAVWENLGKTFQLRYENMSYWLGPFDTNASLIGKHEIRIVISKENYSSAQFEVVFEIRRIHTEIRMQTPSLFFVGEEFSVNLVYFDLDNQMPIIDARINTQISPANISIGRHRVEDGAYNFTFLVPNNLVVPGKYDVYINLTKPDYETGSAYIAVIPQFTSDQMTVRNAAINISALIPAIISLALLWYRVLSVPKTLRRLKGMINAIEKGKKIKAEGISSRRNLILDMMNEDLEPVNIIKTLDDIALSTVDVSVLDVEKLLSELAEVVGLTPDDVLILRSDLDKMRPSERAGFVSEVIKQERARRAREIAEARIEVEAPEELVEVDRKLTEEELAHLRERLIKIGINETEADLMVEQAKSLTKAEVDALLDEIGGDEE